MNYRKVMADYLYSCSRDNAAEDPADLDFSPTIDDDAYEEDLIAEGARINWVKENNL